MCVRIERITRNFCARKVSAAKSEASLVIALAQLYLEFPVLERALENVSRRKIIALDARLIHKAISSIPPRRWTLRYRYVTRRIRKFKRVPRCRRREEAVALL